MGTDFDPDLIMPYFFPASWTKKGIGTKQNDVLSRMEKELVAGALMYPKGGTEATGAVKLTVNAKPRTKGSIGKGGEEDLYTFAAESEGRYVIDTLGRTDVVMKLFGPDNETALIAEDDDSGVGTNARISVELIPGSYYVQVRHYSRKSGTGDYTIKVVRK